VGGGSTHTPEVSQVEKQDYIRALKDELRSVQQRRKPSAARIDNILNELRRHDPAAAHANTHVPDVPNDAVPVKPAPRKRTPAPKTTTTRSRKRG
jgi:hypothetical protein